MLQSQVNNLSVSAALRRYHSKGECHLEHLHQIWAYTWLALDHLLILSSYIHCTVPTHIHIKAVLPLSQASKQADTNAIAITDATLNLTSSITMEVTSANN